MTNIIHPHKNSYVELFSELDTGKRVHHTSLGAWSQAIAQIALEAQKDVLRNMATSGDRFVVDGAFGGGWDIEACGTTDWKTRALVMRQQYTEKSFIMVLVSVSPKPTEEGAKLISEATKRMNAEREGIDLIKRILMSESEELQALRSNPKNFKSFAECPVDEIHVVHSKSVKNLHNATKAILAGEYCDDVVIGSRLNRHTRPYSGEDGYSVMDTDLKVPPSDVVDILHVLSDAVDSSPDRELVDHRLEFIRTNGIETYTAYNADFVGLAARALMSSDGLVTNGIQKKFANLVHKIHEKEGDFKYLPDLADVLKANGHVGRDQKYDCNDMRNQGYLKSDDVIGTIVQLETQNGTYEVRCKDETFSSPAEISLHRVSVIDEYNRHDCGLIRDPHNEVREVACFIKVDGAYRVSKPRTPTDSNAVRDVIDILETAHTITVCLEDEANFKARPGR